jgi:hypothetical protein
MNSKALIAMWVGIGVCVIMGLFPPWTEAGSEVFDRYEWFFDALKYKRGGRIELSRLTTQWIIVALVAIGAVLTLNRSNDSRR